MKAVIYARYSSDNQREESIEGQIRECTAFAEKNDITILRHYIDRAVSAKTDNRPEFQNMIKDSGKKQFEAIIVWKLDRFARNRYDSTHYKAILKRNEVKVISATEKISDSPEGILMESILEGFAEYYSADLSEKIVRGMTENALKGKFNGGRVPIGYVVDEEQRLQIDPLTAPYVLEAFKRYAEGQDMKAIRDWLNEKGITTSKGKLMTYNIVHNMLKNRRYLGEYVFRDMLIPDGIPAIVPVELFDKVQARMELNAKAPARKKAKEEYLLSTKLFCGYCGATICGESGTGRNGESHHYYKCATAKKKRTECDLKPAKKAWLEDLVVNETVKLLQDDKIIDAVVSRVMEMQAKESEEMPFLEARLKEAEDSIDNLLKAIEMGVITKSTKERLEALETEKAELESQIALEKLKQPTLTEEFVRYWLERFRGIDTTNIAHRKLLIEVFLNTVYLYNDKVVITFNYKEDAETINFSDIEAALDSCALGSDFKFTSSPKKTAPPKVGLPFLTFSSLAGHEPRGVASGRFSPRGGPPAGGESRTGQFLLLPRALPRPLPLAPLAASCYTEKKRREATSCPFKASTWPAAASGAPRSSSISLRGSWKPRWATPTAPVRTPAIRRSAAAPATRRPSASTTIPTASA